MSYINYPPTKRRVLLEVAACHDCTIVSSGRRDSTIKREEVTVSDWNPSLAAEKLGLEMEYEAALFAFDVYDAMRNPSGRFNRRTRR